MISTIFGRRCIERRGWGQLSCTLLHASLSSFTRLSVVSVGGGEAGEWSGEVVCVGIELAPLDSRAVSLPLYH